MKIASITVFPLTSERPELKVGKSIHPSWWGYDQALVRVGTDEGIFGRGTAGTRRQPTFSWRPRCRTRSMWSSGTRPRTSMASWSNRSGWTKTECCPSGPPRPWNRARHGSGRGPRHRGRPVGRVDALIQTEIRRILSSTIGFQISVKERNIG